MKKLLLPLTFLFATGIYVNKAKAQIRPQFGIRAGVNFASILDIPTLVEKSPNIGFVGGVYAVIPIPGSSFSIQPEVLYTQKGVEFPNSQINLSYIQVPVFARVDFVSENLLSPHLLLGPYIGFNLMSENTPPVNKTVFGVAFGAGIDINRINIGVRYSQGFSNVFDTSVEGRNSVIFVVAGFQF